MSSAVMALAADPVSPKASRLGGLPLIFLAVGAIGPFLSTLSVAVVNAIRPLSGVDPVVVAAGFRVALLLLALLLGFFGRRSRPGRVGLVGS